MNNFRSKIKKLLDEGWTARQESYRLKKIKHNKATQLAVQRRRLGIQRPYEIERGRN